MMYFIAAKREKQAFLYVFCYRFFNEKDSVEESKLETYFPNEKH